MCFETHFYNYKLNFFLTVVSDTQFFFVVVVPLYEIWAQVIKISPAKRPTKDVLNQ